MATSRGPMSASALKAEMEQRMRDDPEYRAQVEQAEAELAERVRRKREAERPVLDELRENGIETNTLWNLYKTPDLQNAAAPILIRQLAAHPDDSTIEAITAAIGTKTARTWWSDLAKLYASTPSAVMRDRVASLLSQAATCVHLDQMLRFIENQNLGPSRIYFLRSINKIGNRKTLGGGHAVVARFANDSVLGKEAAAILAGKGPND